MSLALIASVTDMISQHLCTYSHSNSRSIKFATIQLKKRFRLIPFHIMPTPDWSLSITYHLATVSYSVFIIIRWLISFRPSSSYTAWNLSVIFSWIRSMNLSFIDFCRMPQHFREYVLVRPDSHYDEKLCKSNVMVPEIVKMQLPRSWYFSKLTK